MCCDLQRRRLKQNCLSHHAYYQNYMGLEEEDSSSTDAENAPVFHSRLRSESGLATDRHEVIHHARRRILTQEVRVVHFKCIDLQPRPQKRNRHSQHAYYMSELHGALTRR